MPTRARLNVGFLLTDSFTLSAFANFVDVLRLAADEADRSRKVHCNWAVLSADMNPVRSSCGVKVQPDHRLRTAGSFDYIVVVGGVMDDTAALSPEALAFVQARAADGVPLVGLCTGVFALHEAGLLDGYRCCVSWFHHQDFVERFDGASPVSDQIFVVDRDRLTCSGGHSAAHLAAHLVARHIGQSAAIKSLNIMIIDEAMGQDCPQPGLPSQLTSTDPLVRKALLRMQQRLDAPEPLADLARGLDTSRRSLERHFQSALSLTPAQARLRLRLERACDLLTRTAQPVSDIALATGFCDAPHLIRAFRAGIGQTPIEYRKSHDGVT